jgi:hypothetical protein
MHNAQKDVMVTFHPALLSTLLRNCLPVSSLPPFGRPDPVNAHRIILKAYPIPIRRALRPIVPSACPLSLSYRKTMP